VQRLDRIQAGGARRRIQPNTRPIATDTTNASTIDQVVTMVDQPAR
jgi:hypothetical protein